MATRKQFLERKDEAKAKAVDASVRDKWSWKWTEKEVDGCLAATCIRKLAEPGKAYCLWCECTITYANSGFAVINRHMQKAKHKKIKTVRETDYRLSGKLKKQMVIVVEVMWVIFSIPKMHDCFHHY